MKFYKVSKKQQLVELISRVPPVLSVDIVVLKDGKYLIGRRNKAIRQKQYWQHWLFPGGRMRYTETPQQTALRILKTETPGVKAYLKKLIAVVSNKGTDKRAYGVTLFYLFEYISGQPKPSIQLDKFAWMNKDELLASKRAYWLNKKIVKEIDLAIRTMNTSEDEVLVEVNKHNKAIGEIIKRDAHSDPKRYHRAAHIVIFNSKGEVILQKRSNNVAIAPGWWDVVGGHQVTGQTIDQTAQAELSEELGITCPLIFKRIVPYKSKTQSEFNYLYYGVHDGPYGYDRNEVEQIKTFDCKKLLARKYKEFKFLAHVFSYVKELKHIWLPLVIKKS